MRAIRRQSCPPLGMVRTVQALLAQVGRVLVVEAAPKLGPEAGQVVAGCLAVYQVAVAALAALKQGPWEPRVGQGVQGCQEKLLLLVLISSAVLAQGQQELKAGQMAVG